MANSLLKNLMVLGLFVGSVVTAGSAFAEDVRVQSQFKVLEYNTVSNKYGERATFIKMKLSDKGDISWIQADLIHKSDNAKSSVSGLDAIYMKEKHLDRYIGAVEKYLKWQEIAFRDGDVFGKEIEKVKSIKFSFHSGNAAKHYMTMEFCALLCVEPVFYFDRENAELFLKFLQDWRDEKLHITTKNELEDKYK